MLQNLRNIAFCLLAGCTLTWAQTKNSIQPQVSQKFEHMYYNANFDSTLKEWPVVSNSENLLIMQQGEYILQRKSLLSPFAAMLDLSRQLESFRLVTSLKIVKCKEGNGSIGLIFMAQPGGNGGFIFEINQNQQYRLRQITSEGYEFLTGSAKESGWVRTNFVNATNFTNMMELRTLEKKYDIYLNGNLLLSFMEPAYSSGDMGFVIGPGTTGKVDFFYLFTDGKDKTNPTAGGEAASESDLEGDVVALAESIIELRSTINRLQQENEDLLLRIESFKGSEQEQQKEKSSYQLRIKSLEDRISALNRSFDSLLTVNKELTKYREMVKGNEDGDIVINLSRNLKAEKLKNEELSKTNQQLRDSLLIMKNNQRQDAGDRSGSNSNPDTRKTKEFVLPKEN